MVSRVLEETNHWAGFDKFGKNKTFLLFSVLKFSDKFEKISSSLKITAENFDDA